MTPPTQAKGVPGAATSPAPSRRCALVELQPEEPAATTAAIKRTLNRDIPIMLNLRVGPKLRPVRAFSSTVAVLNVQRADQEGSLLRSPPRRAGPCSIG